MHHHVARSSCISYTYSAVVWVISYSDIYILLIKWVVSRLYSIVFCFFFKCSDFIIIHRQLAMPLVYIKDTLSAYIKNVFWIWLYYTQSTINISIVFVVFILHKL